MSAAQQSACNHLARIDRQTRQINALQSVANQRGLDLEEARERLVELEAELLEDVGIIRALRRQRDESEAAIERAHKLADSWAMLRTHGSAAYDLREALKPRPAP